jgi:hypothetical protein
MDPLPGISSDRSNTPQIEDAAEKAKLYTAAFYHCAALLREGAFITERTNEVPSSRAVAVGLEMFSRIVEMMDEMEFEVADELVGENDPGSTDLYLEVSSTSDDDESVEGKSSSSEVNIEPSPKKKIRVPLETKVKAVSAAKLHPTWSIKSLRSRVTHRLKRREDLSSWEKDISSGGTRRDKCNMINKWTYERFCECRANGDHITSRMLQQWAVAAAFQFLMVTSNLVRH